MAIGASLHYLQMDVLGRYTVKNWNQQKAAVERGKLLIRESLDFAVPEVISPERGDYWNLPQPKINWSMKSCKSDTVNFRIIQEKFDELISMEYYNHRCVYTDGSKTAQGVGSVFVEGTVRNMFRLPAICSIFSAEAFAIVHAAEEILNSDERTVIISDSMSVLAAVEKATQHTCGLKKLSIWQGRTETS